MFLMHKTHQKAHPTTMPGPASWVNRSWNLANRNSRPALFQLQAIPSTLHGVLKFNTGDGSETVVENNSGNGCDTRLERKGEIQLSWSKGCQKVEDPRRKTEASQALTHESRKRQRDVFSRLTTSLP
uniref:Uncharacterized protein n=1 Tax=Lactuca sativa TaxID=4236 RepID=A0A9R1XVN1_LACSA|nr:hypothetical protein LSAT_V11C200075150 [Lactuca sativa]